MVKRSILRKHANDVFRNFCRVRRMLPTSVFKSIDEEVLIFFKFSLREISHDLLTFFFGRVIFLASGFRQTKLMVELKLIFGD